MGASFSWFPCALSGRSASKDANAETVLGAPIQRRPRGTTQFDIALPPSEGGFGMGTRQLLVRPSILNS